MVHLSNIASIAISCFWLYSKINGLDEISLLFSTSIKPLNYALFTLASNDKLIN